MSDPRTRRDVTLAAVIAAEPSLPPETVEMVFDQVVVTGAALRSLAAALAADPDALAVGAPPVVGQLVTGLVTAGSMTFTLPSCVRCGRSDRKLHRSHEGGVCPMCRRRQTATACVRCQVVKPVATRDQHGAALCARCAPRPQRRCGHCGHTRVIARRAHDGNPDVCVTCFKLPSATCIRCQRTRPCRFATTPEPICASCAPKRTLRCAHCHHQRPPTAFWPEGPVCVNCYDAALSRRGTCTGCQQTRRLVDPPGHTATRCHDCAGTAPLGHTCIDCGIEDKLYAAGRCDRCALAVKVNELFSDATGHLEDRWFALAAAIAATPNPRVALNWLRTGTAAPILTGLLTGQIKLSHQALDAHPRRRAADYLRRMLVAHDLLPERDEDLARTQRLVDEHLAGIHRPHDRQLVQTYATWRVLRGLRRRADANPGPRTATGHALAGLRTAIRLLDWLAQHDIELAELTQADVDAWLATSPSAHDARDFLTWAITTRHCPPLTLPVIAAATGPSTDPEQRWTILARLLHDDQLELTDRVAGCLVLLYAQPLTRITTLTRDQIARDAGQQLTIRLGTDPITVPEPLATLISDLANGRSHTGIGSPDTTPWLFPGMHPGRPLSAARLGVRLGRLGIDGRAGRRAALTHLAAQLPAAVLAELLGISNHSAVSWVQQAGGDWSRYAADLAHQQEH